MLPYLTPKILSDITFFLKSLGATAPMLKRPLLYTCIPSYSPGPLALESKFKITSKYIQSAD